MAHKHEYECYPGDSKTLICNSPGCGTVARISDLLEKVETRGIERGRYQVCTDLLQPTAMLTTRGRKAVNAYVSQHPLARATDIIKAKQVRLLPWMH